MKTNGVASNAKRWALLALVVFVLQECVTSGLFVLKRSVSFLVGIPAIPIAAAFFDWVVPFLVVYRVEKRDARSLGFFVRREKYVPYALYALAGIVLPAVFVGVDRDLLGEFLAQVVWIGLAEEVFNRGYLMQRLCDWLGDRRGLVLGSLLFGLSHVASRLSQHGFEYPVRDLLVGLQTLIGGLVLGFMYLRAKNIVPPAIFHISTNMYLERVIALLRA